MGVTTSGEKLQNFINGKWVDANTDTYEDVPNPATGEVMAKVPISTEADLNNAVQAAKEAFKEWGKTPVPRRARILFRYQQLLVDHWSELAEIITKENGKSYEEAYGKFKRGLKIEELIEVVRT